MTPPRSFIPWPIPMPLPGVAAMPDQATQPRVEVPTARRRRCPGKSPSLPCDFANLPRDVLRFGDVLPAVSMGLRRHEMRLQQTGSGRTTTTRPGAERVVFKDFGLGFGVSQVRQSLGERAVVDRVGGGFDGCRAGAAGEVERRPKQTISNTESGLCAAKI
ncbi:hypothetical protein VTK73DRAFT_1710 [Phialemonium thermophilum]|uniref:Uncharacterized protein n=1 Tax=Phialemonium thermophilum TaxID=223376 RepID=A0ABR3VT36_9PEZI